MKHETSREDNASSRITERKDMLVLAQQKLDEINRCNMGLSGTRPGSVSSTNHRRKSAMSNQLLSTLLYVALMSFKVEDMKVMLQEEDGDVFAEWQVLLDSIHSPEFHAKERTVQNKRARIIFEKKRQYKNEAEKNQHELGVCCNKLTELQKMSNETSQRLSRSVNILQDERTDLVRKLEEREYQLAEMRDLIREITAQNQRIETELRQKNEIAFQLKQQSEVKEAAMKDKEVECSKLSRDIAIASQLKKSQEESLQDLKSRLEMSEKEFSIYRLEKESALEKLHHDSKEQLDEMQRLVCERTGQNQKNEGALRLKSEIMVNLKQELEAKEITIKNLDVQNSKLMCDIAIACQKATSKGESLEDLKSRLDKSETEFSNYRKEKESVITKLSYDSKEQLDGLMDLISERTIENQNIETELRLKNEAMVNLKHQLVEMEAAIKNKDVQNSTLMRDNAIASQTAAWQEESLADLKSRLDRSETDFSNHILEKESLITKLEHDSKQAAVRHVVLIEKLATANQSLGEVRNGLETNQYVIASKLDTLGLDSKTTSVEVCVTLSNLDIKISKIEALVKDANEHQTEANHHTSALMKQSRSLETVAEVNDALKGIVTKLANQSDQMGRTIFDIRERLDGGLRETIGVVNASFSKLDGRSSDMEVALTNLQKRLTYLIDESNIISDRIRTVDNIEQALIIVKGMLTNLLEAISRSTADNTCLANESISRLDRQSVQIERALICVQERIIAELSDGEARTFKLSSCANDSLLKLDGRADLINETLANVRDLVTAEISRLGSQSVQIERALTNVQDRITSELIESDARFAKQSSCTNESLLRIDGRADRIQETLINVRDLVAAALESEISHQYNSTIHRRGVFEEEYDRKREGARSMPLSEDGDLTNRENELYVDGTGGTGTAACETMTEAIDGVDAPTRSSRVISMMATQMVDYFFAEAGQHQQSKCSGLSPI